MGTMNDWKLGIGRWELWEVICVEKIFELT